MPYKVVEKVTYYGAGGKTWNAGATLNEHELPAHSIRALLADKLIVPIGDAPTEVPELDPGVPSEPLVVVKGIMIDEPISDAEAGELWNATDSAMNLAEELGLNLSDVPGTGRDGRVSKKDVAGYAESVGIGVGNAPEE